MTGFPALSRKELGLSLVGLLVLFLFVNGPVWEGPWDATSSIVLSYLPIPLLVAALLLRHGRLKVLPWVLHTLELAFAKFMVTALFLLGLWVWRGNPPPPQGVPLPQQALRGPRPSPTPSTFRPDELGVLDGTVRDSAGQPLQGAQVFVVGGLETFVFAASDTPVVLRLESDGYTPADAVVQVGQPLLLQSSGPALHTAQAVGPGGVPLFNLPLLARGEARHLFETPALDVQLRCTVHRNTEREARLQIVAHPFFGVTDAQGHFLFQNVPKAAALKLRATLGDRRTDLAAKAGDSVLLTLP